MKIIQERQKCIGCGSCVFVCQKYWKICDDGKVDLLGSKLNSKTKNMELIVRKVSCHQKAVNICPVQCIRIIQKN